MADSPRRNFTIQKLISTSSTSFSDYSPISQLSQLKITSDFQIPKYLKPHVSGDLSRLQLVSVRFPGGELLETEEELIEFTHKIFSGRLDLYAIETTQGIVPVSMLFKSSSVLNYLHSVEVKGDSDIFVKASVGSIPDIMSASSLMETNHLNSMLPLGQYFLIQVAPAVGIAKFTQGTGNRLNFTLNCIDLKGVQISNHIIPQLMTHAKRYSFGRLVGRHTLCTLNILEEMLK